MASGATLDATEAHELTVINERPLLHLLPIRSNAPVLLRIGLGGGESPDFCWLVDYLKTVYDDYLRLSKSRS